jgi:hypothetical protein
MYGTPQDVIFLTGIKPDDLGFHDEAEPDKALYDLLTQWLDRIGVAIDIRLGEGTVRNTDSRYKGLIDVSVRTTAKMVTVAIQQRTNPIVQIGDFSVGAVDTTDVIRGLDTELKPYIRKARRSNRINFFSSITPTDL